MLVAEPEENTEVPNILPEGWIPGTEPTDENITKSAKASVSAIIKRRPDLLKDPNLHKEVREWLETAYKVKLKQYRQLIRAVIALSAEDLSRKKSKKGRKKSSKKNSDRDFSSSNQSSDDASDRLPNTLPSILSPIPEHKAVTPNKQGKENILPKSLEPAILEDLDSTTSVDDRPLSRKRKILERGTNDDLHKSTKKKRRKVLNEEKQGTVSAADYGGGDLILIEEPPSPKKRKKNKKKKRKLRRKGNNKGNESHEIDLAEPNDNLLEQEMKDAEVVVNGDVPQCEVDFDEESDHNDAPSAPRPLKENPNSLFWNPNDPNALDPFANESEEKLINSEDSDLEENPIWKKLGQKNKPKPPKQPKVKKAPKEKKPKKLRIKKPRKPRKPSKNQIISTLSEVQAIERDLTRLRKLDASESSSSPDEDYVPQADICPETDPGYNHLGLASNEVNPTQSTNLGVNIGKPTLEMARPRENVVQLPKKNDNKKTRTQTMATLLANLRRKKLEAKKLKNKPRIVKPKPQALPKKPALKPFSHIIFDPKTLKEQAGSLPRLLRGSDPTAHPKRDKEKVVKKRLFDQEGVESIQKRRKLFERLQVQQSKRRRKQMRRIKREFDTEEDEQQQRSTPTGGYLASDAAALSDEQPKEECTAGGKPSYSNLTLEDMVRLEEGSEAEDEAEAVQKDSEEEVELELDGKQTKGTNIQPPVKEDNPSSVRPENMSTDSADKAEVTPGELAEKLESTELASEQVSDITTLGPNLGAAKPEVTSEVEAVTERVGDAEAIKEDAKKVDDHEIKSNSQLRMEEDYIEEQASSSFNKIPSCSPKAIEIYENAFDKLKQAPKAVDPKKPKALNIHNFAELEAEISDEEKGGEEEEDDDVIIEGLFAEEAVEDNGHAARSLFEKQMMEKDDAERQQLQRILIEGDRSALGGRLNHGLDNDDEARLILESREATIGQRPEDFVFSDREDERNEDCYDSEGNFLPVWKIKLNRAARRALELQTREMEENDSEEMLNETSKDKKTRLEEIKKKLQLQKATRCLAGRGTLTDKKQSSILSRMKSAISPSVPTRPLRVNRLKGFGKFGKPIRKKTSKFATFVRLEAIKAKNKNETRGESKARFVFRQQDPKKSFSGASTAHIRKPKIKRTKKQQGPGLFGALGIRK